MVTAVKPNNRMAKKEAPPEKPENKAEAKPKAGQRPAPGEKPAENPHSEKHDRADRKGVRRRLDHAAGPAISGCRSRAFRPAACRSTWPWAARACRKGRIIEIFGPESSGKTTLALHVVAQAQKAGGIAAFIDAEHALDPSWAKKLGVDLETLLVSQPGSGEEAMHITEMLIKIERGGRDRHRLGGRPGAAEGTRRRDRRLARRPAGPADEPGDAQADRRDRQEQDRA